MVIIDILTPCLSSQFSPGDVTNPPVGSLERREEEDGSGGAVEAGRRGLCGPRGLFSLPARAVAMHELSVQGDSAALSCEPD